MGSLYENLEEQDVSSSLPAGSLAPQRSLSLASHNSLNLSRQQTLSAVGGNGAVDHGTEIEAFPGVEDDKEIREPLEHHHPLKLRAYLRGWEFI